MKKELYMSKQSHQEFKYDEMQAHFINDWDIRIGSSTIGEVWRKREENWLPTDDSDKSKEWQAVT